MKTTKRPPFDFSAGAQPSAANESQAFGTPPAPVREPAGWPVWLAALAVTILWAAAPIAYAVGYRRGISPLEYDPFALGVFALLAIGPMVLVWVAAYLLRQGMKLAAQARRSQELAGQMLVPAALAASEAGSVIEAVRRQVEEAQVAASRARDVMSAMRETLQSETERLDEASRLSTHTAATVAETLSGERGKLEALVSGLVTQAAAILEASDRAAEVTTSTGQATEAVRTAGEDLARHTARLETSGAGVGEQMRSVEQELARQRAALLELAERLGGEQQIFATDADARIGRLSELVAQSRSTTAEVGETAQRGAEAIQHLTAEAAERFNELTEAAAREREALTRSLSAAIDQITTAAEGARLAAEAHAAAAQTRVDQLNEAAFEASKLADAAFEARLTQARGLIDQSVGMIDTAGDAARERLEASLGSLVASAQKASEETKALDAAFQQRVRANYEMLSEAVRLMGLVAGEPVAAAPGQPKAAGALRPRLRLTPIATNEEFRHTLEAAAAKAAPVDDGLGWKGLLESLDRDGADPEHLTERMVAQVKAMGFDSAALLPKARIEEIAAAVQTGDADGAVEVVRTIAGTATQTLSKRLFADAALRGQAERYRKRFSEMLRDAAERDHQGFLVGSLLASDEGRAWLLLDAAARNPA